MSEQLTVALITVGITIFAGALGYFFREYRSRVKPFVSIQNIRGDFTKASELVTIPDSIILLLEKSRFIDNLNNYLEMAFL